MWCSSSYSEAAIIEKLPLEKNRTYLMINFLRIGQVQSNFDCTDCTMTSVSTHKIVRLRIVGL